MIKFVDLNTGYLYDGTSPYVHWIPGEQSTGIIYTHKTCLISNSNNITATLESDVFKLLNINDLTEIPKYNDILIPEEEGKQILQLTPCGLSSGYNIYMLYFSASSKSNGEYRSSIKLNDGESDIEVMIGADFYMENESLYINLSNLGVEMPSAIQKALYTVNLKESNRDNIVLNRKMKELLSNYWDVIANKGSYKSLLNSLKWFEWGDIIKLREIWKQEDFGRTIYDDRSLCSILEEKYLDTLNGFSKTTHLAIYLPAQQMISDSYDSEFNPVLEFNEQITSLWSKDELMLKLCLLGNFYETYFMPIHLNLFHSTIENIVFTNTFKIINTHMVNRYDFIDNVHTFNCNVKDMDVFVLGNVKCYVGPNTKFGTKWNGQESYEDIDIVGVEDDLISFEESDDNLKTFYSQLFNGVGVIVPFECCLDIDNADYIIESKLSINNKEVNDYTIYYPTENNVKINFKLLFQKESRYKINIQFKTAGSVLYTKSFTIDVKDISGMDLKVYKIKRYKYLVDSMLTLNYSDDYKNFGNYIFSRYPKTKSGDYVIQYIPTASSTNSSGICLNNILVLKGDFEHDHILKQYYFTCLRNGNEDLNPDPNITDYIDPDKVYTICISKSFWFEPEDKSWFEKYIPYIYRNDYGFFPMFHYLEELDGNEDDYVASQEDTMVLIPELPLGLEIEDMDWEFINISRNEVIKLPNFQEPYVANLKKLPLSTGYYDVVFKFRTSGEWRQIKRSSIFNKK